MQPWGAHFGAGAATPANIWSQQARRKGGQVFPASLVISLTVDYLITRVNNMNIHFSMLLRISYSVGLLLAAGEQISQVSGIHVESTVVGHGGCSYHGYRTGQWWGKDYEKKIIKLLTLFYFRDW